MRNSTAAALLPLSFATALVTVLPMQAQLPARNTPPPIKATVTNTVPLQDALSSLESLLTQEGNLADLPFVRP